MFFWPLVSTFDQKFSDEVMNSFRPALVLLSDEDTSAYDKLLENIAMRYHSQVLVGKSKISSGLSEDLSQLLGVTAKDQPVLILYRAGDGGKVYKYKMPELTEDKVASSIEEFFQNKLKQYFKSESAPDTNDGAVKVAVGSTFE